MFKGTLKHKVPLAAAITETHLPEFNTFVALYFSSTNVAPKGIKMLKSNGGITSYLFLTLIPKLTPTLFFASLCIWRSASGVRYSLIDPGLEDAECGIPGTT